MEIKNDYFQNLRNVESQRNLQKINQWIIVKLMQNQLILQLQNQEKVLKSNLKKYRNK